MKWMLGLATLARKHGYSVKTGWIKQLKKFTPRAAYLYASTQSKSPLDDLRGRQ